MTPTWKGGWGGSWNSSCFRKFFLVLKQKIYCSFLQMEGVGVNRIGHFLWTSQIYDPTWFKITANSVIRGSSFFFNIKPYITIHFDFHREQRPAPLSPLHWWPNQRNCYCQFALNFLFEKSCGLMNIASWLNSPLNKEV